MATLALILAVWRRQRALDRLRSTWIPARISDSEVLLSEDTGPAIFGLRESTVVLPKWTLDLDEPHLALVLEHEREHAREGDPRLLFAATLVAIAMPWNLAIWWQLRRLRLALEVDCDSRVLRRSAEVRRYATLLIAVGQRLRTSSLSLVTLGEPSAHLRQRITIMSASKPRHPVLQSLVVAPIVLSALIVACSARNPGARTAGEAAKPQVAAEGVMAGRANADSSSASPATEQSPASGKRTPSNPMNLESPVVLGGPSPRYPDALRVAGVEGEVVAQFVVDTSGRALPGSIKVISASSPEFVESLRAALPGIRFKAPGLEGKRVRQLVQHTFTFKLAQARDRTSSEVSREGTARLALWTPITAVPPSTMSVC